MTAPRIDLTQVSFAEGLQRVAAHLENALLFYESGRTEQALVQASRPMVELMPRLSRDLWDAPKPATELNRAVAAIAAGIRSGLGRNRLRSIFVTAEKSMEQSLSAVLGEAAGDPVFVSSVVVALLRTAGEAYRESAPDSAEGGARYARLDAVSFVRRARRASAALGDVGCSERLEGLQSAMSADEPISPASADRLIAVIATELNRAAGAILAEEPSVADHLQQIEGLLSDVETAYSAGNPFRADKLAARAYIENFLAAEDELFETDPAAGETVGTALKDLRLRMRAKAPADEVAKIAERGRGALATLLGLV